MKLFRCPNCNSVKLKKNNVKIVLCLCGEFMKLDLDYKEFKPSIELNYNGGFYKK